MGWAAALAQPGSLRVGAVGLLVLAAAALLTAEHLPPADRGAGQLYPTVVNAGTALSLALTLGIVARYDARAAAGLAAGAPLLALATHRRHAALTRRRDMLRRRLRRRNYRERR